MIIIQSPNKDTYVTDINTSSNNALHSNVGQSSTIDIFKITGENKKTFAKELVTFNSQPVDGDFITLIDYKSVEKTFEFDSGDGVILGRTAIQIGNTILDTLNNTINIVNAEADFGIDLYKLYDDKIVLKQKASGESGDTNITAGGNNIVATNFIRFEHSAGLISFDLEDLKNKHLSNINLSVFSDSTKFKAILRLIDVGKSSTRPKNYELALNVLDNSFKEGLGKDVIHFSDVGDANFSTLDSTNNIDWNIEGLVSSGDIFEDLSFSFQNFLVENGNEDVEFDITEYIHEYFKETANFTKEDFVIHFPTSYLFDNNTYFVKRFGSRNLKNKQYTPQLLLKIDDDEIENIITEKKRYFDNEEKFFLLNIKGNKTKAFIENQDVKLRIEYIGEDNIDILTIDPILGQSIYNYKGEKIQGIKKFEINDTLISQINEDSKFNKSLDELKYVPLKFTYYYDVDPESVIKSETVDFYMAETDYSEVSFNNSNIRVSIDILQKNVKANNSSVSLKVSFIDVNKQYKSVNKPIQLYSEDLGDITYSMYDVDSSKELIKNSDQFTKLKFNGKHYALNIFSSENFKNKRVNFIFKYTDPLTGLSKEVSNDNTIIRFV